MQVRRRKVKWDLKVKHYLPYVLIHGIFKTNYLVVRSIDINFTSQSLT